MSLYSGFSEFFPADGVADCQAAATTHKDHPLSQLILEAVEASNRTRGATGEVLANTCRALRLISKNGDFRDWLARVTRQACDTTDYSSASSALAEIRALGAILEMEVPVSPVPRSSENGVKTPDFHIHEPFDCYVEVHCKQMNNLEAKRLEEFRKAELEFAPDSRFAWAAHAVQPLGGDQDETTVENVAQKFAQVKPRSEQAVERARNILWFDLQDYDMWAAGSEQLKPVVSSHQRFYSGGLWLAFYGVKGTPLLEHHHLHEEQAIGSLQHLRFDGRFQRDDEIFDAAILYLPGQLVVMQNSHRPSLDANFVEAFMKALRFRFELSWLDWPIAGTLTPRIRAALADIDAIGLRVFGASEPDTWRLAGLSERV